MKKVFSSSNGINHEYCATVVRVGSLDKLPNSDFLAKTEINGFDIIVRTDDVKEGDIVVYCPIETELCSDFLSSNNLYELGSCELNSNGGEVSELMREGKVEEAKGKVGFFNKNGRVRMIRLRKQESMGLIIKFDDLLKWKKNLDFSDVDEYIGEDFDTIDGKLFIKAYVPKRNVEQSRKSKGLHRNKKLRHFDRIIPGTFQFHYDTRQLNKNMDKISPDDTIDITEKMDGTSFIVANIPVKKKLTIIQKIRGFFDRSMPRTEYDLVYSSRTVIKNKYINRKVTTGFYNVDVWGDIAEKIGKYIPKDMTVYGECIGYITGSNEKLIQVKGGHKYTYGCEPGKNKIMPYRIVTVDLGKDGKPYHREWNISEVDAWVCDMLDKNKELEGYLTRMNIFYHGKAMNLYPDLSLENHWNENFLERLKNDKNFLMECYEPTCPPKTPAEGIVIRKENDSVPEAFKLKCMKYLLCERDSIDNGETDIEMSQTDY